MPYTNKAYQVVNGVRRETARQRVMSSDRTATYAGRTATWRLIVAVTGDAFLHYTLRAEPPGHLVTPRSACPPREIKMTREQNTLLLCKLNRCRSTCAANDRREGQ